VGAAAGDGRKVVEASARDMGLEVRFCPTAEVLEGAAAALPDVIGLELPKGSGAGLSLVRQLAEAGDGAPIVVAAEDGSMAAMRAALEAGAVDVVSLPLAGTELRKALVKAMAAAIRSRRQASSGEVITVCGARGGLGATTLAVNLAARLAALGNRTALVDLDLQRGDVAAFLNLTPTESVAAIAAARGRVDEVLLQTVLVRHGSGVVVLPAPPQIEDAESIDAAAVDSALRLVSAEFRFTVVDTPRVVGTSLLTAAERSDRLLLLSDLSVPGVRAARRLLELFLRLGLQGEQIDLVVTRIVPGPVSLTEIASALDREPIAVIPRDEATACDAMNAGVPLNGRQSGLTLAVAALAARLAGVESTPKPARSQLLQRLFQSGRKANA
jgi:pilus assembly protein CpaE